MSENSIKTHQINILSSFILKLVAILTMTIDHVGESLNALSAFNDKTYFIYIILKSIGRLALPLFCFMIVEGVIHTKSFSKYCLRLGIIGTAVLIAQIVLDFNFPIYQGNIFIDLLLGALLVKALMNKRIWVKLLAILPLGIGVLSFFCSSYIGKIYWFPYFLRPQYDFLGILLIACFYLSYILFKPVVSFTGADSSIYEGTNVERMTVNTLSCALLIIVFTLYYLLGLLMSNHPNQYFYWNSFLSESNWAMISGAFILLYSGKRGYNSNWFKYGQYLYYPLHILVIFGICYLIIGGI